MTPDEYLEKLAFESYKREVDQDESIWRSMPFLATSIALVVTVIGYSAQRMAALIARWPEALVYGLLAGAAAAFVASFGYMLWMVRQRLYRYPPTDLEFAQYAEQLREYHLAEGVMPAELNAAVVADLRQFARCEFGAAAAHNRANNLARQAARTRSFLGMLVGLALALAASVVIFFSERYAGLTPGGAKGAGTYGIVKARGAPITGKADTARSALRGARGAIAIPEEELCSSDGRAEQVVSDKVPASGAAKPAANPRPTPPAPQYVKKNEEPSPGGRR